MTGATKQVFHCEHAASQAHHGQERPEMKTLPWRDIFAWLLAAFFVLGGSLNIFATAELVEDYRRWGYPGWFHYVTGSLEWMAAALIMLPVTRLAGSTLAAAIMVSAAGTVLMHGEY
jgi:uncharacterized membrane protein YphA (DoxX/SURF4 family)